MKNEEIVKELELLIATTEMIAKRATALKNKLVREGVPASPKGAKLSMEEQAELIYKRDKCNLKGQRSFS